MPDGGAHTVGTGIAAANYDHVLVGRQNVLSGDFSARNPAILLGQKIHRKVNAAQFAARNREIARLFGTAR